MTTKKRWTDEENNILVQAITSAKVYATLFKARYLVGLITCEDSALYSLATTSTASSNKEWFIAK